MSNLWNSVRREIVERLFEAELDEDFNIGIAEGYDRYRHAAIMRLENMLEKATKKNQPGIEAALQLLKGEQK